MLKYLRRLTVVMLTIVTAQSAFTAPVGAVVESCSVQVSPGFLLPGSLTPVNFSISNTSSNTYSWIKITRPSDRFVINGLSQSGWSDSTSEDGAEFMGGSLDPGQNYSVTLGIVSSIVPTTGEEWLVQVSDDVDGGSPMTCTGQVTTDIRGHLPNDDEGSGVSNVLVNLVGTSQATITWSTESPMSSLVYFGQSAEYGGVSTYIPQETMSHKVVLSGLTPGTVYHFQVAGIDSGMGVAYSADNTFVTTSLPAGNLAGPAVPSPASVGIERAPNDFRPPEIVLDASPAGVWSEAPQIRGTVSDDVGIALLEYSTDNGRNWIAISDLEFQRSARALAKVVARFSFRPVLAGEGNYEVRLRATDAGANITEAGPFTVIIDRLEPRPGPLVVQLGGQTVEPDALGQITLPQDADFKLALSVVGGAQAVTIAVDESGRGSRFSLGQSADAGVWAGVMRFGSPGTYPLHLLASDGAGRTVSARLGTVHVVKGFVVEGNAQQMDTAEAYVYVRDEVSKRWVIWDGRPYGQVSQVRLKSSDGTLPVLLPPGEYYIKVKLAGALDRVSEPFSLDKPTALSGRLDLTANSKWMIGPWNIDLPVDSMFPAPLTTQTKVAHPLVGRHLPNLDVPQGSRAAVSTADWFGRPTVLLVGADWVPGFEANLQEFNRLSGNSDVNALAVFAQQDRLRAEVAVDGIKLPGILADPDGLLYSQLAPLFAPTFVFADRQGIIKQVMVGNPTSQQILEYLGRIDEVKS